MPKDQPTSHGSGRSRARHLVDRGARGRGPRPRRRRTRPRWCPAALVVPRVLNRSTAIPASAGSRQAALRKTWLSIMPPCVGSGCRQTIVATGARSTGRASSPTRRRPSDVVRVSGSRRAGSTLFATISGTRFLSRSGSGSGVWVWVSVADPGRGWSRARAGRARSSRRCASGGGSPRPTDGPPATPRRAGSRAGSPGRSPGSDRSSSTHDPVMRRTTQSPSACSSTSWCAPPSGRGSSEDARRLRRAMPRPQS